MAKFASDTQTGRVRRNNAVNYLNTIFIKRNLSLLFKPLHESMKLMTVQEIKQNNKVMNRTTPVPYHKAIGLHYSLSNGLKHDSISFVIMVIGSGGFYLKIPSDALSDPKSYLDHLIRFNYHTLIIPTDGKTFSKVFTVKEIDTYWKWHMSESRGNKNRMCFEASMKDIRLLDPFTKTLSHPDLIQQLTDLFK